MSIECLGCGAPRAVDDGVSQRRQPGECPRCGYLGWAASSDLSESDRRGLRVRPLPVRRIHLAQRDAACPRLTRLRRVERTLPAQQLWGKETSKAFDTFPVSGEPIPASV